MSIPISRTYTRVMCLKLRTDCLLCNDIVDCGCIDLSLDSPRKVDVFVCQFPAVPYTPDRLHSGVVKLPETQENFQA